MFQLYFDRKQHCKTWTLYFSEVSLDGKQYAFVIVCRCMSMSTYVQMHMYANSYRVPSAVT